MQEWNVLHPLCLAKGYPIGYGHGGEHTQLCFMQRCV